MINGKDYIFSALDEFISVSGDTLPFSLEKGGEAVFEGVARKFPDGSEIRFYLNRLASAYLDTQTWENLLFNSGITANPDAGGQFRLLDENDVELCSAYVIKGYGTDTGVTNEIIDGRVDPRMKIFVSHAGAAENLHIDY